MENMDGDVMMKDIVIREFNIADRAVAARFAMEGMHLDRYVENALERWIYEKYVIREALARSNYLIGAYRDDKLVGFLFGCFKGQPLPYRDSRFIFLQRLFKLLERLSPSSSRGDAYDAANRAMKASLRSEPDVELVFFAIDPACKRKGVGTKLLAAFERACAGMDMFLRTDDACTYQFYEHRGFMRAAERDVAMGGSKGTFTLKCMMYVKHVDA